MDYVASVSLQSLMYSRPDAMDALLRSDLEAARSAGLLGTSYFDASGRLEAPLRLSKAIACLQAARALRWIEDAPPSGPCWEYDPEANPPPGSSQASLSLSGGGTRCPGLIIGWAEHLDIGKAGGIWDPQKQGGAGSGGIGGVKKLRELKLDGLLRADKATALQRHAGLTRYDRVLEVSYKEPLLSTCNGCTPKDRDDYINVGIMGTLLAMVQLFGKHGSE